MKPIIVYSIYTESQNGSFLSSLLSKFRLPRQLPSRTLGNSQFPIAVHADLLEVPEFTEVNDEHFRAHRDNQPFSQSPRIIMLKAVLGERMTDNRTHLISGDWIPAKK